MQTLKIMLQLICPIDRIGLVDCSERRKDYESYEKTIYGADCMYDGFIFIDFCTS